MSRFLTVLLASSFLAPVARAYDVVGALTFDWADRPTRACPAYSSAVAVTCALDSTGEQANCQIVAGFNIEVDGLSGGYLAGVHLPTGQAVYANNLGGGLLGWTLGQPSTALVETLEAELGVHSCDAEALAKVIDLGLVLAVRADYCGDGQTHTSSVHGRFSDVTCE